MCKRSARISRWYHQVTWVCIALLIASGSTAVLTGVFFPRYSTNQITLVVAIYISAALSIAFWFWITLAVPLIESGDAQVRWRKPPRKILLEHRIMLFALPQVLAAYAIGAIAVNIHDQAMYPDASLTSWWYIVVVVGFAAASLLPSLLAMRWHCSRFMKNVTARRVCYQCGYDLRATTCKECPECGYEAHR